MRPIRAALTRKKERRMDPETKKALQKLEQRVTTLEKIVGALSEAIRALKIKVGLTP